MKIGAKILFTFTIGVLALLVITACTPKDSEASLTTATDFETIRANYRDWIAIQENPTNVSMMIFTLCRLPSESEMAFAESEEHGKFFLRDYFNDVGFEALTNQTETFPVGTIIVKEKFREISEAWDNPEALGMMIKRDEGFNSASNDWEFLYWDEAGVLWEGIETTASCQACHSEAERDFVFEG